MTINEVILTTDIEKLEFLKIIILTIGSVFGMICVIISANCKLRKMNVKTKLIFITSFSIFIFTTFLTFYHIDTKIERKEILLYEERYLTN